jgi:hypothetical protein
MLAHTIKPPRVIQVSGMFSIVNDLFSCMVFVCALQYSLSTNQTNKDHDDSDNEQYMNKATYGKRSDDTEEPENNENDCYCS